MTEEKSLALLDGQRDPEQVLEAASRAAKALQKVVESKEKKVMIGGRQHLMFEDWQTLGQFYGCTVRTCEARPVEIGEVSGAWARAEVIDFRTGVVVAGAEAYCMSDEENWVGKPWFQLASMAQTRAGAKALRNRLAWVAVLAGYEPTPAEEMTSNEGQSAKKPERWCEEHGVAFRRFQRNGEVWYSHKQGDSWCNEGKTREVAPAQPKAEPKSNPKGIGRPGAEIVVEPAMPQSHLCAECVRLGKPSTITEFQQGDKVWTADKIAHQTLKNYDEQLCWVHWDAKFHADKKRHEQEALDRAVEAVDSAPAAAAGM